MLNCIWSSLYRSVLRLEYERRRLFLSLSLTLTLLEKPCDRYDALYKIYVTVLNFSVSLSPLYLLKSPENSPYRKSQNLDKSCQQELEETEKLEKCFHLIDFCSWDFSIPKNKRPRTFQ